MKPADLKHFAYGRARRCKDNDHQSIQNMRAAGFAVVVIEPKDLGAMERETMEHQLLAHAAKLLGAKP